MDLKTYAACDDYINQGRNKISRPLPGTHTSIRKDPETQRIIIKHHDTDIFTWLDPNLFQMSSPEWKSKTTKERLNEYMPRGYTLFTKNGAWYLQIVTNWTAKSYEDKNVFVIPFVDGMVLHAEPSEYVDYEALSDSIDEKVKKVRKYIHNYMKLVDQGELACQPSDESIALTNAEMVFGPIQTISIEKMEELVENMVYPPELLERAIYYFPASPYAFTLVDHVINICDHRDNDASRFVRHPFSRFVRKCLGMPL